MSSLAFRQTKIAISILVSLSVGVSLQQDLKFWSASCKDNQWDCFLICFSDLPSWVQASAFPHPLLMFLVSSNISMAPEEFCKVSPISKIA